MKYILFLLSLLSFGILTAQENPTLPVQWSYDARKTAEGEYELVFRANIQEGWKLFALSMPDDLPNTRLQVDSGSLSGWEVLGMEETSKPDEILEPLFDNARVRSFRQEALFRIRIRSRNQPAGVKGIITWMAMKGEEVAGPEEEPFRFEADGQGMLQARSGRLQESAEAAGQLLRSRIDLNNPVNECGGTGLEDSGGKSLWSIFLLGFLGGLIGLLTPCVFPMIPLTVSFFTKRSASRSSGIRNAVLYGSFILAIYVVLSIPFHLLDSVNPEILNNISTNVWLNVAFFVIFVAFALSFFGLYEITLPSAISNTADSRAGVTSLAGIFFMALTLAIVSFSCTGPILGSLLAGSLSTDGGAWQLTAGMAGFGLALALPFALFALFPNWLQTIPKSGGWLNTVKIVLGFLELALAVKFLSNADLVEHWGLLKREVFFAIWIIIGICLALYLFGILRFRHDPPPAKLGPVRITLGLLTVAFVIYLLPGLTNTRYANRALISGFPPPLTYSIYGHEAASGKGVEPQVMNDYEKALALSKELGKPLLIDFTGWACVNCRKMEENVWTQPAVKEIIEKQFILVSLYVDDRAALPDDQQFLFTGKTGGEPRKIRTIGDKYATLQAENFSNASQPLYVILSGEEKLMNRPVGYTPDAEEYQRWLECGLEAYRSTRLAAR